MQIKFQFVDKQGSYNLTVTPSGYSCHYNRTLTEDEKVQLLKTAMDYEGVARYLREVIK